MGNGVSIVGFLLIIAGLFVAIFTGFAFVNQVTLIEFLPAIQQYLIGAVIAIMLIVIGFLILYAGKD